MGACIFQWSLVPPTDSCKLLKLKPKYFQLLWDVKSPNFPDKLISEYINLCICVLSSDYETKLTLDCILFLLIPDNGAVCGKIGCCHVQCPSSGV